MDRTGDPSFPCMWPSRNVSIDGRPAEGKGTTRRSKGMVQEEQGGCVRWAAAGVDVVGLPFGAYAKHETCQRREAIRAPSGEDKLSDANDSKNCPPGRGGSLGGRSTRNDSDVNRLYILSRLTAKSLGTRETHCCREAGISPLGRRGAPRRQHGAVPLLGAAAPHFDLGRRLATACQGAQLPDGSGGAL